ncbi:ferredoxin [Galdieria sulphuraria]|uniref:Ferredoxin n=1 Tax=Galdieria sulphuraria TaxID=130081 RepID=M2XS69_GALSU|nr:ferredoxin [Galdieria sulphuraria]EME26513.1 ferredoxin [Galdieria sulphuraria]|eukprot:XP_005703033.1 ferredoxin [Galdieria sulphuraria]
MAFLPCINQQIKICSQKSRLVPRNGFHQRYKMRPLSKQKVNTLLSTVAYPSTTTCELTVLYGNQQIKKIQVEQGQTLLEAMESSGLPADSSCRAGVCMTCAVKLLEGEVDNEEAALASEAKEAGFVLACSAYPLSPKVKIEINHGDDAYEMQYGKFEYNK